MTGDVYANGNAISCKAGGGKVIAAFPDVCLSPPSPPAGPIPVPYPDTSFSKDMKKGSKTVKIGGKEVMLKDKSFYKSSPLGNEAATRSFGANVLTHVITGKTYFGAWSMDVQIEGENVPRHIDLTTSNHASYPGGSGPMVNAEKLALARIAKDLCPCCGKKKHSWQTGTPMNMEEWYTSPQNNVNNADALDLLNRAGYAGNATREQRSQRNARPNCTCNKPKKKKLLPSPPCDVFFPPASRGTPKRTSDKLDRNADWNNRRAARSTAKGVPTGAAMTAHATQRFQEKNNGAVPSPAELRDEERKQRQHNHLTPKIAGGCNKEGNTQANFALCGACQMLDEEFNEFQNPL